MAKQVSTEDVAKYKNIQFEVTYTLRNQIVSVSSVDSDFVIEIDGLIFKNRDGSNGSTTVTLVGGNSNFINEKIDRSDPLFYLSEPQKWVLSSILKQVAINHFDAELTSSDGNLDGLINAMYFNSVG